VKKKTTTTKKKQKKTHTQKSQRNREVKGILGLSPGSSISAK
jgi:hypothetical protein